MHKKSLTISLSGFFVGMFSPSEFHPACNAAGSVSLCPLVKRIGSHFDFEPKFYGKVKRRFIGC